MKVHDPVIAATRSATRSPSVSPFSGMVERAGLRRRSRCRVSRSGKASVLMLAHSWFAGDQPRDGEEDDGNRQARRRRQVARSPVRVELRLVLVEAFEIVEFLAEVEDRGADLMPERRERMALQAGQ